MQINGYDLTSHAYQQARRRRITRDEIAQALQNRLPKPNPDGDYYYTISGRTRVMGDITAIVNLPKWRIVSVYFYCAGADETPFIEARPPVDRELNLGVADVVESYSAPVETPQERSKRLRKAWQDKRRREIGQPKAAVTTFHPLDDVHPRVRADVERQLKALGLKYNQVSFEKANETPQGFTKVEICF